MAGYIGAQPFTKASYDKELHVATNGQTLFNVVYNVHFLDVLVNGVEVNTTDYVANDGTTVTFNSPLAVGDEVTFKIWGTFNAADTYTQAEADAQFAPLVSPGLTGTPTAPTATAGDNSTKLATTEFVQTGLGSIDTTIPAGSITSTELATGTTESNWVTGRTAAASGGEVGTYAFCAVYANTSTNYSIGSTIAGSSLRYIGLTWDRQALVNNQPVSGTPSGTWRCMGYANNLYNGSSYYYKSATLWLRIA